MTLDNDEALIVLKASKKVPKNIVIGREMSKELFALIEGDEFANELIKNIEHLESSQKAEARKKYSRSITDFFERLSQPIGNIYSSVGGSKRYDIDNENTKKEYLEKISKVSGNMSLEKWLRQNWMPLYHADPNGVIMWEWKNEDAYPTYKGIDVIRNYKLKGQNVDWILFEPEKKNIDGSVIYVWRLVDDETDRIYYQRGDEFDLQEDLTFPNPFGKCPAIVNSDLTKLGYDYRISPYFKIVDLCKEYARDQSIKTIYKFQSGFPIHWRYVSQCRTCTGTGKLGDDTCSDCSGKGYLQKGDVTDMVTLPLPEEGDQVIAPNIAGFIAPDLETWNQYNTELQLLEEFAYRTHWSITATNDADGQTETATGRYIDLQPQINKLNEYADTAEWVEAEMSEMLLHFVNEGNQDEGSIYVNYGRRYILESSDTILEKYHTAKENDDNAVIKDRLLSEYITAKYKNDPKMLREEILKAKVEPYVHDNLEDVANLFGSKEASKKTLFGKWWSLEADIDKTPEQLISDYETWFNQNYIDNGERNGESQES